MTSNDLWKEISTKNPSFNGDGNVTLSAKGLRKLFDLAYDKGFDQGKAVSAALNDLVSKAGTGKQNSSDIFSGIFGDTFKTKK